MAEQNQQRQVAVKSRIADILGGEYVKDEGWNPNYILARDGRKISRVNLLGTVVSVPTVEVNYRSVMLDDGSAKISVRSFDETDVFRNIALGDVVFIIGRPRQYGTEIYLMPEIVKKVQNKLWIEVRKLELEKAARPAAENPAAPAEEQTEESSAGENAGDEADGKEPEESDAPAEEPSSQQKVYGIIKELDKGDGVEFEAVIEKSGCRDAEKIVSRLLKEGEIFELGKGRLKVLE